MMVNRSLLTWSGTLRCEKRPWPLGWELCAASATSTSSPVRANAARVALAVRGRSRIRCVAASLLHGKTTGEAVALALGDLQLAADVEAGALLLEVRRHRAPPFGFGLRQPVPLARLRRIPDRDSHDLVPVRRVALVRAQHPLREGARFPGTRELLA